MPPAEKHSPRKRVRGKERDRLAQQARELYLGEGLPIRAVGKRLGDWSYGATHRLLTQYRVPLRGRGASGQLAPRAKPQRGKGSSAA